MTGFITEMRSIYCSVRTDYVSSLKVKVPKKELCCLSINASSKFETCMGDAVKQIRTLIRNKLKSLEIWTIYCRRMPHRMYLLFHLILRIIVHTVTCELYLIINESHFL